jgi:hypothetical protein
MKTLHVILKNKIEDGCHEHIEIDEVGSVSTNDMYLMIYSDEIIPANMTMGKFDLSEVVGYWIEEA